MKGDFHVRFCENTEVKSFCVTRLVASVKRQRPDKIEKLDKRNKLTI